MKKMITLLVLVLGVVTANAQKLSFPTAWEQYRNQMTFLRSESHGNDMWRDIYLYNGNEFYNEGHCPTCKDQQPINVDNSNTVNTYDRDIEMAKVMELKRANDLKEVEINNDLVMDKKENRREWILGAWRNTNETSNQVAVWNDKYKSNISSTSSSVVYGSTATSQGGSGSDADGINPDGTTTGTQVIDYTLLNQNQGGNGGDQGGILPGGRLINIANPNGRIPIP
jgi:hypothetical protein